MRRASPIPTLSASTNTNTWCGAPSGGPGIYGCDEVQKRKMQQIKAKGRSSERMHDPLQPSRRHRQLRVAKTDDE